MNLQNMILEVLSRNNEISEEGLIRKVVELEPEEFAGHEVKTIFQSTLQTLYLNNKIESRMQNGKIHWSPLIRKS